MPKYLGVERERVKGSNDKNAIKSNKNDRSIRDEITYHISDFRNREHMPFSDDCDGTNRFPEYDISCRSTG